MEERIVLAREQVRRVDRIAVERYGIAGVVLMENAGRGVVDVLLGIDPGLASSFPPAPSPWRGGLGRGAPAGGSSTAPHTPPLTPPHRGAGDRGSVVVLCGKGNNAGDGFVIARHLAIRGVAAKVLLAFPHDQLTGDARTNYKILTRCDVPIVELPQDGLAEALDQHAGGSAWLVDALLGTGAVGDPREPVASIIRWMNDQPARRLAVDVPSGLDCDTGLPSAATVRADVTCTFVAPKIGMVQPSAGPFVGELHVVSIGVPAGVIREAIE